MTSKSLLIGDITFTVTFLWTVNMFLLLTDRIHNFDRL